MYLPSSPETSFLSLVERRFQSMVELQRDNWGESFQPMMATIWPDQHALTCWLF
ncbi:MAG: hypothetical protein RI902_1889 [Pseudomonadota bacterium]